MIPVLGVYYISINLTETDLLRYGFLKKGIEYFAKFLSTLISISIAIIFVAIIAAFCTKVLAKSIQLKFVLSILFFILGAFFIVTYLNLIQGMPFHRVLSLVISLFIMGIIISAQSIFKYVISIIMNVFMIISFYALFSSLIALYTEEFNEPVNTFNNNMTIGSILLTVFAFFFTIPIIIVMIYKKTLINSENGKISNFDSLDMKPIAEENPSNPNETELTDASNNPIVIKEQIQLDTKI